MLSEDSGNGADEVRPRRENELCAEVRLITAGEGVANRIQVKYMYENDDLSPLSLPYASHTEGVLSQQGDR